MPSVFQALAFGAALATIASVDAASFKPVKSLPDIAAQNVAALIPQIDTDTIVTVDDENVLALKQIGLTVDPSSKVPRNVIGILHSSGVPAEANSHASIPATFGTLGKANGNSNLRSAIPLPPKGQSK